MTSRLFVALWPDDAARGALATALDGVRSAHPEVRWQPPERWHLTLAFLGQARAESAARRIGHALSGSATARPIRTAGAGAFWPVLWAGVEHGPWLTQLALALQRELRVPGRRFRAHITVGRIRGAGAPTRARSLLADCPEHSGPWWTPPEVTLVESTTGPHPTYHVLDRWPLGPEVARGPATEPR